MDVTAPVRKLDSNGYFPILFKKKLAFGKKIFILASIDLVTIKHEHCKKTFHTLFLLSQTYAFHEVSFIINSLLGMKTAITQFVVPLFKLGFSKNHDNCSKSY